ncbi:Annexin D5 [Glycine soja]|uniref:Annexin D5 n=1 Tax=Glycine soja TaxID=3848 RepID=A0A445JY37_GLYSO|nr:Annexin D5 [Glycine soja]
MTSFLRFFRRFPQINVGGDSAHFPPLEDAPVSLASLARPPAKGDTHKTERLAMTTLSVPPVIPSPREDAIKLHKAFKGLGCDTSKVIKILAHRNAEQRSLIQQEFETNYSELLSKRLSKELRGHVKKAVLLWLHDPATRDAKVVRKALTISVVDNQAITEIICSRTPSQLRRLKEVYLSTYHSYLEQDIESKTSGDHKKVLDPPLTPIFLQGIFGCALFLV